MWYHNNIWIKSLRRLGSSVFFLSFHSIHLSPYLHHRLHIWQQLGELYELHPLLQVLHCFASLGTNFPERQLKDWLLILLICFIKISAGIFSWRIYLLPQFCSSLLSAHSFILLHLAVRGTHWPFAQLNWDEEHSMETKTLEII